MLDLVPIDVTGKAGGNGGPLPEMAIQICHATAAMYVSAGFVEPWISYLAIAEGSTPVGTCGFKSPPREGRVEIAYYTFPEFVGRGYATAMAVELIAIARRHQPAVLIVAQTLPERGASHRILEKLGFVCVGTVEHPEDGTVLEWRLRALQNA